MTLKSNLSKFIKEVLDGFLSNKGKGSVYCVNNEYAKVVKEVIEKFREKSPENPIFIVVDTYTTRQAIVKALKTNKDINMDIIKVISADYVNEKYRYAYRLIVTVGIDDFDKLKFLNTHATFMISLLTKSITNTTLISNIRSILPDIKTTVSAVAVRADHIYSPVEEVHQSVKLSIDDQEGYQKYTDYITNCTAIFGTLDNIQKCKFGDSKLNISGSEFRNMVARENGWNEELDTTVEFQKQIDDTYNPNVLLERAMNFYNMAHQRRNLLTDNLCKLDEILSICQEHKGERIMIVSMRAEFARTITNHINENSDIICRDYHDCIPDAIAMDMYGEVIPIKSGKDKGKPKILKAQSLSTLNLSDFNNSVCNVLSIKNASDTKLKTAIDVVIFTSPFCNDIIDFKTRFTGIEFTSKPNKVYKIYCSNTIESSHLSKQKESPLITIINKNDDDIVNYNENSGDIILDI